VFPPHLQPWRERQHTSPRRGLLSASPRGVLTQKNLARAITAVKKSDLTKYCILRTTEHSYNVFKNVCVVRSSGITYFMYLFLKWLQIACALLYSARLLTVQHPDLAELYVEQDVFLVAVFIDDVYRNRLSENTSTTL
jgi:hypothetical protein